MPAAAAYFAWVDTSEGTLSVALDYFLLNLVGLSVLAIWATEFTVRMRRVSMTGNFDVGLPMPSLSYRLLGSMGQLVQELSRPIVAVHGPNRINEKIAVLARSESIFRYMHVGTDGAFKVDPRIVPVFRVSDSVKQSFTQLVDFLVQESVSIVGRISRSDLEASMRNRLGGIVQKHSEMFIQLGLLDRLASGMLSDRISSGLMDFDLANEGGYPKSSAVLLCGPPSDERNLLLDSFIGIGLSRGDSCIYVTSAQPPENVKRQFGSLSKDLTIVDCYTNRIREVPTISVDGNVITTPIEISVVAVAISRILNRETDRAKRAVLDILPTYLVFQKMEKLYIDLMEIIDDLRKAGYTAVFSLNPYYIKDEGAVSTLQELFDGVIHVERTADESGITGEITIRIEKMGRQGVPKPTFKIRKPGQPEWNRPRQAAEISAHAAEPSPVEA